MKGLKGFFKLGYETYRGVAVKFFSANLYPIGGEKFS